LKSPQEIVNIMMEKDQFSNWLGLTVTSITEGSCELSCTTNDKMLNGFEILHGGISYSLSDSALAFASNSRGYKCVSVETSISHLLPVFNNEKLRIVTNEIHRGKSIGIYVIDIFNSKNELISKFKGTVSISKEAW
jgi:acyl-CoA thioesterase